MIHHKRYVHGFFSSPHDRVFVLFVLELFISYPWHIWRPISIKLTFNQRQSFHTGQNKFFVSRCCYTDIQAPLYLHPGFREGQGVRRCPTCRLAITRVCHVDVQAGTLGLCVFCVSTCYDILMRNAHTTRHIVCCMQFVVLDIESENNHIWAETQITNHEIVTFLTECSLKQQHQNSSYGNRQTSSYQMYLEHV